MWDSSASWATTRALEVLGSDLSSNGIRQHWPEFVDEPDLFGDDAMGLIDVGALGIQSEQLEQGRSILDDIDQQSLSSRPDVGV